MRASLLIEPGSIVVSNINDPPCPPGGILIEVAACSLCASDVKMARAGHRALSYPRILGHEVVGRVIETDGGDLAPDVGDMVQVWPGIPCGQCRQCLKGDDNLCSGINIIGFNHHGGLAERMAVPRQSIRAGGLNKVPASVSPEEASLAEPLACCLQALERSNLDAGDSVLIFGGGPMGLMTALAARSQGLKATVVEVDPHRRQLGKGLGVEMLSFDEAKECEASNGQGADGIVLCTPQVPVGVDLIPLLAPRGRICVFSGLPPALSKEAFDWNALHYRELSICGSYGCSSLSNRRAIQLIASGSVKTSGLITHRFSLSEINRALDCYESREGLKCVINEFR